MGKDRNIESGLDYFGARYYNSELGRWYSVDPMASKYPGWSPYNYCKGDAVNSIDPSGAVIINPYDPQSQHDEWLYVETFLSNLQKTEDGRELYNRLNNDESITEVTVHMSDAETRDAKTYDLVCGEMKALDKDGKLAKTDADIAKFVVKLYTGSIASSASETTPYAVAGHELSHVQYALEHGIARMNWEKSKYEYYSRPYEIEGFRVEKVINEQYFDNTFHLKESSKIVMPNYNAPIDNTFTKRGWNVK